MRSGVLLGLILLISWCLLCAGRMISFLVRRAIALGGLVSALLACDWCAYYFSQRLCGSPHSIFTWPIPGDIVVGVVLWTALALWALMGLVGTLVVWAVRARDREDHVRCKNDEEEHQAWVLTQAAVLCGVGGLVVAALCEALLLAQLAQQGV